MTLVSSMPDFNFEEWLEKHDALVKEALSLFLKHGLKAVISKEKERKPSFIRIFFGKKNIDFFVKEIGTKMSMSVWLCKKADFGIDKNFLIHAAKENVWIITTGRDADREGEYKTSDWQEGTKYVVVPMEIFRPAKTFIKLMKIRMDSQMQKRISEF